jgi:SAM-dependent methyltransferase
MGAGAFAILIDTLSEVRSRGNRVVFRHSVGWGTMNLLHRWLCRSARWRKTIEQRVPWVLGGANLGSNVLELGPGPGLTTDLLRLSTERLTALEIDSSLADSLRSRMTGSNVEVIRGDATAMPFDDAQFSGGVSFTMLHHVPSAELQDKLLREVWRVLAPGGEFVGSDSRQSLFMRLIHIGDTMVLVDPKTFAQRLEAAGFDVLEVETKPEVFRFHARRPVRKTSV